MTSCKKNIYKSTRDLLVDRERNRVFRSGPSRRRRHQAEQQTSGLLAGGQPFFDLRNQGGQVSDAIDQDYEPMMGSAHEHQIHQAGFRRMSNGNFSALHIPMATPLYQFL
jgi:hypothetical protein